MIPTYRNSNGGWYQKGHIFTMPKRFEVGYQYLDLCISKYLARLTCQDLATLAKISKSYARKVIIELENTGLLTDPEATNSKKGGRKRSNIIWNRRRSFSCWLFVPRTRQGPTATTSRSWSSTTALLCLFRLFLYGLKRGLTTRVHSANRISFLLTSFVKRT